MCVRLCACVHVCVELALQGSLASAHPELVPGLELVPRLQLVPEPGLVLVTVVLMRVPASL